MTAGRTIRPQQPPDRAVLPSSWGKRGAKSPADKPRKKRGRRRKKSRAEKLLASAKKLWGRGKRQGKKRWNKAKRGFGKARRDWAKSRRKSQSARARRRKKQLKARKRKMRRMRVLRPRAGGKLQRLLLAYIQKQLRKQLGSNGPATWRNHGYKGVTKPGRTGLGGR